jgi:hypothetical protein
MSNLIFFQEEMFYVAQNLINFKETKDDVKAGADLQYTNQHKNPTISFRITDAERKQIEARIIASGMMKKDYFVRSCIYNRICVVGKKETIYPLVQTVNALYLQLLEMQKVFTTPDCTPDTLPSSEAIKELQTEYTNMLTAIIALLDGAKYLWEGDCHEKQS